MQDFNVDCMCCLVSNQSSHQESVFVSHHVPTGHLPAGHLHGVGAGLVVGPGAGAGPDAVGEVVVDE